MVRTGSDRSRCHWSFSGVLGLRLRLIFPYVHKLKDAVVTAFPQGLPAGVDELKHADTSVPAVLEFLDIKKMITET